MALQGFEPLRHAVFEIGAVKIGVVSTFHALGHFFAARPEKQQSRGDGDLPQAGQLVVRGELTGKVQHRLLAAQVHLHDDGAGLVHGREVALAGLATEHAAFEAGHDDQGLPVFQGPGQFIGQGLRHWQTGLTGWLGQRRQWQSAQAGQRQPVTAAPTGRGGPKRKGGHALQTVVGLLERRRNSIERTGELLGEFTYLAS